MKSLMIAAVCGAMALAGTAQAQQAERATIVVRGEGKVEAAPDTFAMSAQVIGRGADQAEAVRKMVATQTAVTDAVSRLEGLTATEVTTGLPSVTPVYDERCTRDRDRCVPAGYVASLEVKLEGMPAERGGDAVSLAAERGAQNSRLTGLTLSNDADLKRQAARAAMADARRQAEDIAQASGQRLVGIRDIQAAGRPDDPFYGALEANAAPQGLYSYGDYETAATPITLTPGPVTLHSALTVTFEIE